MANETDDDDTVSTLPPPPAPDYYAVHGEQSDTEASWIKYSATDKAATMSRRISDETDKWEGWKIHVSASTPEARDKLVALAARHKLVVFKVVNNKRLQDFLNPGDEQCGKIAVFYCEPTGINRKRIDWVRLIREASQIVEENGGPGPDVQRDRKIPGTCGVFYRCDRNQNTHEYIARAGLTVRGKNEGIPEDQLYNPYGAPEFLDLIGWPQQETPGMHTERANKPSADLGRFT